MNLKTTFILILLLAGGGAGWYALTARVPATASSKSLEFLDKDLKRDALTRIEIERKGRPPVVLEKSGKAWTLPGKWPVRGGEVRDLVDTLTNLHSRFAPELVDKNTDLGRFGLGDTALALKLTVGDKTIALKIGEQSVETNQFTRPSFLTLDDSNEIIRLGPGLVAALDRPIDYFQQRRLFPAERVAKDGDAGDKIEQVVAERIRVHGPDGEVAMVKTKDGWQIESPIKDRVDPDKLRGILAGLIDIWADRFVAAKGKTLDEMGLTKPEFTFEIKRPDGGEVAVLVGGVSSVKDKTVTKPGPPTPFGPGKPMVQTVKEEYRYAKLPSNDQIFEIKSDKLKELAVPLAELRDARLARFKADDVRKLEIVWKGKTLAFAKDKDKWRIEKPGPVDAESQPIADLLDKLAVLEARGPEIRDKENVKTVNLDAPIAKVTLTLEESKKEDKTARTIVYTFGENPMEKGKLFVRVADWPRLNLLGDELVKFLERDVLAYRQRRLFDWSAGDLAKIQIVRGGETFAFARKDGAWSQVAPSAAKVEQAKVEKLVGDIARLETPEFVADAPNADDLDKTYGLAKPGVTITLQFADDKKPSQTIVIGKQRVAKDDSFARIGDGPVFAVKKDFRDHFDYDALSYRPTQAWHVNANDIVELRIKKDGQGYSLTKDGGAWKLAGAFAAPARPEYVDAIADELAELKSEKYVAQIGKDLAKFGLDKPYLEFEVVSRAKDKKDAVATLQVGKVDDMTGARFARVGEDDAVFLVSEKALSIVDRGPLDLLDRVLLKLDVAGISQLRIQGPATYTLEKKKDAWQVADGPAPAFNAEDEAVQSALRPWGNLLAGKIAAYGPKIDWAKYGLEKPEATIVVSAQNDTKKAVEHTLALGKDAGDGKRFARVDQQQAVAILEASTVKDLSRSYLDFVNPRILKFAFDSVTRIDRIMEGGNIELAKTDDAWQLAKPNKQPADSPTVDDILDKTFQLKVRRVAALGTKDLKKFGLEPPVAVVKIHLGSDKVHTIKIGDKADAKADERYAVIDDGTAVVVLPADLSRHLTAGVSYFVDRNIASLGAADRLEILRGDRKAVFAKAGLDWKLIDPLKADAEESLGDFVQSLFRLRADEIVAGKDADLKSFGLEPPVAEWKIAGAGKDVLDIQIGAPEKGKEKDATPRRYARLGKGDQVFLLNAKQSAAALAEYRNRKPWPPLDAAQIALVTVTGDAKFALIKRDNAWTVKDRPADKVSAKAVTDLLDALGSLKVDRYLADAKGNLQLYGLEPPTTKIDLFTPTGPRTLLLGRTEGDSRRVYAAIAGSDAVFILGEADAARLLRPLTAYLETK